MARISELIIYWQIVRDWATYDTHPEMRSVISDTIKALEELKKLKGAE